VPVDTVAVAVGKVVAVGMDRVADTAVAEGSLDFCKLSK
jgi:hypothetical protein